MNKFLLTTAGSVALLGLMMAAPVAFAKDAYSFSARGTVQASDRGNKTMTLYMTHIPAVAEADLGGKTVEFDVSGTKFYKYVANKKGVMVLTRTTQGNIPVQSEVTVKGVKKSGGGFKLTEVVLNNSDFTIVGKIQGRDKDNKTITIAVTYSTYKSSSVVGKDLLVYYGDNTKVKNGDNKDINLDELADNQENAKLMGTVTNATKWEVTSIIDGYKKSK